MSKQSKAAAKSASTAAPAASSSFLRLKSGHANKLGPNATGQLRYDILSNPERSELFIMLTGNSGGGSYSQEQVPFARIEACVGSSPNSFVAKVFRSAFVGKSTCNAGFLAAILHAEALIEPLEGKKFHFMRGKAWETWKAGMRALSGEPVSFEKADAPAQSRHASAWPLRESAATSEEDGEHADHP